LDSEGIGENMDDVLARSEMIHSARAVQIALDGMARNIDERMARSAPVLLAVMTGGMVPAVWLSSRLHFPHQMDYVHATRYVGGTRGGQLAWRARPGADLAGRAVLIVDDILDEGITLRAIVDYCQEAGAREVKVAVLVQKRHDRNLTGLVPDFKGLDVPDRYVFGCGMDYREYFRNLPAIYALTAPEDEDP